MAGHWISVSSACHPYLNIGHKTRRNWFEEFNHGFSLRLIVFDLFMDVQVEVSFGLMTKMLKEKILD